MAGPEPDIARTLALMGLWKDIRSKPKDIESINLELGLPSIRYALPGGSETLTELTGAIPPIQKPPAPRIDLAHYISRLTQTGSQLMVLSILSHLPNGKPSRRLVALSVPPEVAKQLLLFAASTDTSQQNSNSVSYMDAASAPPAIDFFAAKDAVGQLCAISSSHKFALSTHAVTVNHGICQLLYPSRAIINVVELDFVITITEAVAAEKLIDLLACNDHAELHAAAACFSDDEFFTARALLDRLGPSEEQRPNAYEFSPSDVAAAHSLRALYASDDVYRPIGPLFLAFSNGHNPSRLTLLSHSEDVGKLLFDLFLREFPIHPRPQYSNQF